MTDNKNSREKLVEKARTEYGIANAEAMSDEQLKAEVKALDKQRPTAKQPVSAKSSDTENKTAHKSAPTNQ